LDRAEKKPWSARLTTIFYPTRPKFFLGDGGDAQVLQVEILDVGTRQHCLIMIYFHHDIYIAWAVNSHAHAQICLSCTWNFFF
jgi:hypothetical protein